MRGVHNDRRRKDSALRKRERHCDMRVRCATRAGVEDLDRPKDDGAVVQATWLHQSGLRTRFAGRRQLAHRHAWAGRRRLPNERRVPRSHHAGATCVYEYCGRQRGKHLLEGEATVTFAESNNKTSLILRTHAVGLVSIAPQMLAGMEAGWTQSMASFKNWVAATDNVSRTQRSA
jgi:hypothetical protein